MRAGLSGFQAHREKRKAVFEKMRVTAKLRATISRNQSETRFKPHNHETSVLATGLNWLETCKRDTCMPVSQQFWPQREREFMFHNTEQWPYVVTLAKGPSTIEELRAFCESWNAWLDDGKPFIAIRRFLDEDALQQPDGGAREIKQWFQQNAERVRNQVMGMISIVPESVYEEASRMDAERLFRVPAGTFSNVDAALHWLDERVVRPNRLAFDKAAIRAKLEAA